MTSLKTQLAENEGLLKSSREALKASKKEFQKLQKTSEDKQKDLQRKIADIEKEAKVFVNLVELEEARLQISPLRKKRRIEPNTPEPPNSEIKEEEKFSQDLEMKPPQTCTIS